MGRFPSLTGPTLMGRFPKCLNGPNGSLIGTLLAFYKGQQGIPLEHSEQSLTKGFLLTLGHGVQKARERVDSDNVSNLFRLFFDFLVFTVRSGQSTVGGPKWTKMDLFRPFARPKWTILVSRMLESSSE